jgi:hypothetical protein
LEVALLGVRCREDLRPHAPNLREELLLKHWVAREAVESVDDQPPGLSGLEQFEGLGQTYAGLDPVRTGDPLVSEYLVESVTFRAGPRMEGFLLNLEAQTLLRLTVG